MDKFKAIKKAGSTAALAAILGVTRQAVEAWVKIPPLRMYQLKDKRPSWFRRAK